MTAALWAAVIATSCQNTISTDSALAVLPDGTAVFADTIVTADGKPHPVPALVIPSNGQAGLVSGDTLIMRVVNNCLKKIPAGGGIDYNRYSGSRVTGNYTGGKPTADRAGAFFIRYDGRMGLFRGFLTDKDTLPWGSEIHNHSLATNITMARELKRHAADSTVTEHERQLYKERYRELVRAINDNFWMPQHNTYSTLLYGAPATLQANRTDLQTNLSAIFDGIATPAMARAMVRRFNITPENAGHTAAIGIAGAMTANPSVLTQAIGHSIYNYGDGSEKASAEAGRDLITLLVNGVFGISYHKGENTFALHPTVPAIMSATQRLQQLKIGEGSYDITISGHGDIITSATSDCQPADPAHIGITPGHHTLSVTLNGWAAGELADAAPPELETVNSRLYVNSVDMGDFDGRMPTYAHTYYYNIVHPGKTYASKTHLVVPPSDSTSIDITPFQRPGARSLRDKEMAKKFAESTRYKNHTVEIPVNVNIPGDYLLTFSYFNGLGIVNPDRKYAVRDIAVNGADSRLVLFPQLNPDDWTPEANWQSFRGHTVHERFHLNAGINTVTVSYTAPPVEGFNHDNNSVIIDKLTIIKL